MPAARDVYSASCACTSARACAGDAPVPDPAVSSLAVTSVVLRRDRNSSLVSENMVWNVSLSMSATNDASPTKPSAFFVRASSISSASPNSLEPLGSSASPM